MAFTITSFHFFLFTIISNPGFSIFKRESIYKPRCYHSVSLLIGISYLSSLIDNTIKPILKGIIAIVIFKCQIFFSSA